MVENFHLYSDQKFIQFLEQHLTVTNTNGEKKVDYTKLNEPVNIYDDVLLHYAVFHNKEVLCEYLLQKGADPNKMNKRKKSPYTIAKSKNFTKLLQMFDGVKANK